MRLLFAISFCLMIVGANAQYNRFEEQNPQEEKNQKNNPDNKKKKSKLWGNLQLGGNLGLAFGPVTFIEISPRVYGNISDKDILGIGGTYIYFNFRSRTGNFQNSIYGAQLFYSRVLTETFFLHSETELINMLPWNQVGLDEKFQQREWVPGFFLGGGIRREVGGSGFLYLYGLYNLLYNPNLSVQPQPWLIRIGYAF